MAEVVASFLTATVISVRVRVKALISNVEFQIKLWGISQYSLLPYLALAQTTATTSARGYRYISYLISAPHKN